MLNLVFFLYIIEMTWWHHKFFNVSTWHCTLHGSWNLTLLDKYKKMRVLLSIMVPKKEWLRRNWLLLPHFDPFIRYEKFVEKLSSMCANIRTRKNAKKIDLFSSKNEYFIQYKCGFFIQIHFDLRYSPIIVSLSTSLWARREERLVDEKV